ncbi:MAG: metallophosphoesterase [Verrucomicrobiia bacterium]
MPIFLPIPITIDVTALVTADLHYTLPQFDWVRRHASDNDVCIVAGDFLDLGGLVDLDTQIIVTDKWARKLQPRSATLLCSGNHDLEPNPSNAERQPFWLQNLRDTARFVDGQTTHLQGWRLTLLPWWDGPGALSAAREQLLRDAHQLDRGWIWISHAPPSRSPVAWTGRVDAGDPTIREWIEEFTPNLVLSGHVHHAPFAPLGSWRATIGPTTVLNPGRQSGSWPAHILLDFNNTTARWIAADGSDTCTWSTLR